MRVERKFKRPKPGRTRLVKWPRTVLIVPVRACVCFVCVVCVTCLCLACMCVGAGARVLHNYLCCIK
jgi:hypothetical protein